MTKTEMLEKLRKLARMEPVTPGIEDIVIRIYMEDDDYDEFLEWVNQGKKGTDEPYMSQVKANMAKRIKRGKLKTGYDPYNDKDLDEASGTLSTNQNIGKIGVFVIWGKRESRSSG